MANTLRIKRRAAGGAAGAPASLAAAELAFNEQDNTLYYGKGDVAGVASTVIAIGGSGAFSSTSHNHTLSSLLAPTANVAMGGYKLTGLGTPTASTDAATMAYVDSMAQGLSPKTSVRIATSIAMTVAATSQTLTGDLNPFGVQDGISLALGERILVKNQADPAQNGIYTLTTQGVNPAVAWVLTRANDTNSWDEHPGAYFFVQEGTVNAEMGFVCTSNAGGTLGTTALNFQQFSGAGQITASGGLQKSANTISIATAGVTLAMQANMATGSIVYRKTAGTGVPEVQTLATLKTDLGLTGTNSGDQTGGTPALVLGTANTAGVSTNFIRRDDTILVFDATVPLVAGTAAAGSATVAARRDHVHPVQSSVTGSAGSATHVAGGTTGSLVYQTGVGATGFVADVATGNVLLSGGVGVVPVYGKVTLTGHISGVLPIANGGTNSTATPTAGGVGYGTGSANAYTPVGVAGQFLKSNAGSAPTWTSISLADLPDAWTKKAVRLASTVDIAIATGGLQTLDSTVTVANDRVLLKNQTAQAENGIYQVNAGAWTRVLDMDSASEAAGATVSVDAGLVNAGMIFTNKFKLTDTLGTTIMPFYSILDTAAVVPRANGGAEIPVRAATTADVALSTAGNTTIDGVSCVTGDRVLVKNQSSPAGNGIYTVLPVAWARTADATTTADLAGFTVSVLEGTANGGLVFHSGLKSTDTLNTTPFNFHQVLDTRVAIPAVNGGTGFSSYAVGDLLFASSTTALAKLADVATGNVLLSGGVGVAPSYGKVALSTHVSGTLPVSNGGTGVSTFSQSFGLVYGNGTSALGQALAGTAGNILFSGGPSAAPTWSNEIDGGSF